MDVLSRVFLKSPHYEQHKTDIVFANDMTQILASRMYLQLSDKGVKETLVGSCLFIVYIVIL
jgi:hypothetical protein